MAPATKTRTYAYWVRYGNGYRQVATGLDLDDVAKIRDRRVGLTAAGEAYHVEGVDYTFRLEG